MSDRTRFVRPCLEHLETRTLPAAFLWIGGPGNLWGDHFNWLGPEGQTPGPGDTAYLGGDKDVNLDSPVTVKTLTLNDGYEGTLNLNNHTLTLTGRAGAQSSFVLAPDFSLDFGTAGRLVLDAGELRWTDGTIGTAHGGYVDIVNSGTLWAWVDTGTLTAEVNVGSGNAGDGSVFSIDTSTGPLVLNNQGGITVNAHARMEFIGTDNGNGEGSLEVFDHPAITHQVITNYGTIVRAEGHGNVYTELPIIQHPGAVLLVNNEWGLPGHSGGFEVRNPGIVETEYASILQLGGTTQIEQLDETAANVQTDLKLAGTYDLRGGVLETTGPEGWVKVGGNGLIVSNDAKIRIWNGSGTNVFGTFGVEGDVTFTGGVLVIYATDKAGEVGSDRLWVLGRLTLGGELRFYLNDAGDGDYDWIIISATIAIEGDFATKTWNGTAALATAIVAGPSYQITHIGGGPGGGGGGEEL